MDVHLIECYGGIFLKNIKIWENIHNILLHKGKCKLLESTGFQLCFPKKHTCA